MISSLHVAIAPGRDELETRGHTMTKTKDRNSTLKMFSGSPNFPSLKLDGSRASFRSRLTAMHPIDMT